MERDNIFFRMKFFEQKVGKNQCRSDVFSNIMFNTITESKRVEKILNRDMMVTIYAQVTDGVDY